MIGAGAAPPRPEGPRPWWESRPFVAALILLAMVPLLYPPVPPLVDLYGHMGRFRVQLDLDQSQWLRHYYGFEWGAIGNLGVDLAVIPLTPLVGLEAAVKLIVLAIPPLTVAGFLWVAREVHNRLPPTALFALPFIYGYPFLFGFVNFALSMALAFLAFGLWLRLGRLGRLKLRAILFVPISIVVFFTHTFGWGTLGLLCFSAEAVRQHDRGAGWIRSAPYAALHAASMAFPMLFMVAWRSDMQSGMTRGWFHWPSKFEYLYSALRDRWQWLDVGSVALVVALLLFAAASRRLAFSRNLAFSALVLAACFVVLPWKIFGSAFADMRLVPFIFAVAVLAIRYGRDTDLATARLLAIGGLAFYGVRLAATGLSLALASNDHQAKLAALDHVPMGAAVATLANQGCGTRWALPRNSHLGAMVIVRREGFSNDQWMIPGTNLLTIRYRQAGPFKSDASEMVRPAGCAGPAPWTIDQALRALPRDAFDYVFLLDAPVAGQRLAADMPMVWSGAGASLHRVRKSGAILPEATHRTAAEPARPAASPARTGSATRD